MSSTNTLSAVINLTGQETLDTTAWPAGAQTMDRTLRATGLSFSGELSASTTPAIGAQPVQLNLTIGAGVTTVDLTAAAIGVSRTADMTARKIIAWIVKASASNVGAVLIGPGASNGYPIWGAADGKHYFHPGQTAGAATEGVAAATGAVGASSKDVAVSGTQNDTVEILLWFGT